MVSQGVYIGRGVSPEVSGNPQHLSYVLLKLDKYKLRHIQCKSTGLRLLGHMFVLCSAL